MRLNLLLPVVYSQDMYANIKFVFQLNSGGTMQGLGLSAADALDWRANFAAARRLYLRRGWQPWVCSGRRG